jgi:CheY-like chemotaxis protein
MPFMNGFELLATIRTQPRLSEIPAVAITAWAAPGEKEQAFEAGFAVHIAKPCDLEALLELVEWIAERR